MTEMHLRQPGFTSNPCWSFAKNKERIQKFKETADSRYIDKHKLDKACFQHDVAFEDFKDLSRRTASNISKNPKYDIEWNTLAVRGKLKLKEWPWSCFYSKGRGAQFLGAPDNF